MAELWIDKYRPGSFDEFVGQTESVEKIKSFIVNRNVQHLLFVGPSGTGKTTAAMLFAKAMLNGAEKGNILELNGSTMRKGDGAGFLSAIHDYLTKTTIESSLDKVPFRFIIIHDADLLSTEFQASFRRAMEQYSEAVIFVMICTNLSKIINPIQSRCAVMSFRPLRPEQITELLDRVIEAEKLDVTDDVKMAIVHLARGNARNALDILQSASVTKSLGDMDGLYELSNNQSPAELTDMLNLAMKGDIVKARGLLDALSIDYGYTSQEILSMIYGHVFDLGLNDSQCMRLMDKIAEVDYRLTESDDARAQIGALLAYLALNSKAY